DERTNAKEYQRPVSLTASMLFPGDVDFPYVVQLKKEIASSDRIDILMSFVKISGISLLRQELDGFAERGGKLRLICTTYTGATEALAVEEMAKRAGTEVKVSYDTGRTRLHAKAFIFYRNTGFHTAYIGSANLSKYALTDGKEWNIKITCHDQKDVFGRMVETFETYWASDEFEYYRNWDYERLSGAILMEKKRSNGKDFSSPSTYSFDIRPYPYQEAILDKLQAERERFGYMRNLVVAATGTGKTVVSAFDYKRFRMENKDHSRLLFVAHREEILDQSLSCFRGVLKNPDFGDKYTGSCKTLKEGQNLFASIQMLARDDKYKVFSPTAFDYIVVDEFHHAVASSYRKVLEYFNPKILLGLTATPERMDGKDILSFFSGNRIAAEIRLPEAIERELLVPFHYFGVSDSVDLSSLKWNRGDYDEKELEGVYVLDSIGARKRADLIIRSIENYFGDPSEAKCIGFCVSIRHATFMADFFRSRGLKAITLSKDSSEEERKIARERIRRGEINYIFVVDLYNEGVDIPEIDTVMFLRPTQSLTVFLQQLARGLRTS
ncbi:MAG: DEAD/DEAH box helicase family protein, partial [Candidatus Ornithospirochaeta sp.]